MSVRIEVNALGFDPGEGGAVPSRTTIDVKVQFLRSRVNCVNKLNHFIHGELGRYASNGLISRRPWVRIPDHGLIQKNEDYMKKQKSYSQETQEEKEARWAKQRKNAISFAKQAGIKVVKKKTQSDTFDY